MIFSVTCFSFLAFSRAAMYNIDLARGGTLSVITSRFHFLKRWVYVEISVNIVWDTWQALDYGIKRFQCKNTLMFHVVRFDPW